MTTKRTAVIALALAVLVVAGFGAVGYAFRARLATLPVVGTLFHAGPQAAAGAPTDQAGSGAPLDRAPVTIDARRQQLLGVRTVPVAQKPLSRTIRTVGTVEYDETSLADINLKLDGWIDELFVDYTGKLVNKGDPLLTIYSPDLVTTQNEYLLALKTREQMQQSQVAEAREYADRLVQGARQRLELWDLPPDQFQKLVDGREVQRTMTFRSPVTGVVIEKQAVKGMRVSGGNTLYRIADLSVVWVEADFYESELALLRDGQQARVTLDAYPGEAFTGRVIYVYPYVEEQTRTGRVRFQFPNPRGRLKPGMYGHVEIQVPLASGLTVPTNALLDSGTRQFVFVALGDGQFEPRRVTVGQRLTEEIQILEGLEEGERVATNATFFIDAESQLRAALDGFEAAPPPAEPQAAGERLEITYRSQPDPPRTGATTLEVTVRDPEGQPVTAAEVAVVYFMAAMPTMNMPAMRTNADLSHAGNGVYRGTMNVMMGGRWEVTVNVTQDGKRIGSRQLTVVAR